MKTTTESVTPQRAAEWLKKNTRNRHMSPGKVARFVRDLLSNNWPTTHQSIGLAPTFVVDGQHRLEAIKESGVTVELNVTHYETDAEGERALMAVDITDKRTAGDMLEIAEVIERGSGKNGVALARMLFRLGFAGTTGKGQPTISEIQAIYKAEQVHIDWVLSALATEPGDKKRFSVVHRVAFVIAHMLEPTKVEHFARQIQNAEAPSGSVAQAWMKAETEGRFKHADRADSGVRIALRLIQAELLEELPPKKLQAAPTVLSWFRTQVEKKRERAAKAAEHIATVMQ